MQEACEDVAICLPQSIHDEAGARGQQVQKELQRSLHQSSKNWIHFSENHIKPTCFKVCMVTYFSRSILSDPKLLKSRNLQVLCLCCIRTSRIAWSCVCTQKPLCLQHAVIIIRKGQHRNTENLFDLLGSEIIYRWIATMYKNRHV